MARLSQLVSNSIVAILSLDLRHAPQTTIDILFEFLLVIIEVRERRMDLGKAQTWILAVNILGMPMMRHLI
jgi:hypothetical protein